MPGPFASIVAGAIIGLFLAVLIVRLRGGGRPGAAASGTVYELLNEDRRKAIEIIIEERAAARDPEDKDGDLPQLEHAQRRSRE
jgi:hypothetical protein